MEKKKVTFYEKLVFVAYGYFIVLGLGWFFIQLLHFMYFDYWALATILIFTSQAYFRKKLTNLIIGILTMGLSIYGTMEFVVWGDKAGFDSFICTMLSLCFITLIMSGILMFSYTKLSFKDQ